MLASTPSLPAAPNRTLVVVVVYVYVAVVVAALWVVEAPLRSSNIPTHSNPAERGGTPRRTPRPIENRSILGFVSNRVYPD